MKIETALCLALLMFTSPVFVRGQATAQKLSDSYAKAALFALRGIQATLK
jgi:hypothetical protein